ncbi:MAG: gluconate 2-dehydrogenase subunit 3 family protein [Longimicrobiales bacterium]
MKARAINGSAAGDAALLAPVRPLFRALTETIVPQATALDERAWTEVESTIESALARREPRLRRQLVLFIRAIGLLSLIRYGRPFTRLDARRRTMLLTSLQEARSALVRRGFWGLRTLALMGYYARDAAAREIGYRARAEGWEARA